MTLKFAPGSPADMHLSRDVFIEVFVCLLHGERHPISRNLFKFQPYPTVHPLQPPIQVDRKNRCYSSVPVNMVSQNTLVLWNYILRVILKSIVYSDMELHRLQRRGLFTASTQIGCWLIVNHKFSRHQKPQVIGHVTIQPFAPWGIV